MFENVCIILAATAFGLSVAVPVYVWAEYHVEQTEQKYKELARLGMIWGDAIE